MKESEWLQSCRPNECPSFVEGEDPTEMCQKKKNGCHGI